MSSTTLTLLTSFILFVCTFVRSAVGFGDALLAMPLLGLIMSLQSASPIVAFTGFTISLIILLSDPKSVDFNSAWRLILSTIIGVPFGLLLLNYAPERLVKVLLGLLLILYGIGNLVTPKMHRLHDEKYAFIFGFVAGILGGAIRMDPRSLFMERCGAGLLTILGQRCNAIFCSLGLPRSQVTDW